MFHEFRYKIWNSRYLFVPSEDFKDILFMGHLTLNDVNLPKTPRHQPSTILTNHRMAVIYVGEHLIGTP